MVRVADAAVRRAEIVEATIRLIGESGLEAATMRRIAQAFGSTTALVTHHFGDKEKILLEVLRICHVQESALFANAAAEAEPRRRLRRILEVVLPNDPDRRVWVAFWSHATHSSRIEAQMLARYEEWVDLVTRSVEACHPGADPAIAMGLIALIDGIGVRAVAPSQVPTPTDAMRVVDLALQGAGLAPT